MATHLPRINRKYSQLHHPSHLNQSQPFHTSLIHFATTTFLRYLDFLIAIIVITIFLPTFLLTLYVASPAICPILSYLLITHTLILPKVCTIVYTILIAVLSYAVPILIIIKLLRDTFLAARSFHNESRQSTEETDRWSGREEASMTEIEVEWLGELGKQTQVDMKNAQGERRTSSTNSTRSRDESTESNCDAAFLRAVEILLTQPRCEDCGMLHDRDVGI